MVGGASGGHGGGGGSGRSGFRARGGGGDGEARRLLLRCHASFTGNANFPVMEEPGVLLLAEVGARVVEGGSGTAVGGASEPSTAWSCRCR